MTEDKSRQNTTGDYVIFISVPLCAALGLLQYRNIYKSVGLLLFVFAFCIIYRLYKRASVPQSDTLISDFKLAFLSDLGFIISVSLAVFAEMPLFRWLFLMGILLSVIFSGILSALMSVFAYVLIIIIFTEVSPEFVANTLLTSVLLIILTRYFSDFSTVIYSVITIISFEVAFFLIMHGMNTKSLLSASHIKDALVIIACIVLGWVINTKVNKDTKINSSIEEDYSKETKPLIESYVISAYADNSAGVDANQTGNSKEPKPINNLDQISAHADNSAGVDAGEEENNKNYKSDIKEVESSYEILNNSDLIDKKDYSYLLNENSSPYRLLAEDEILLSKAKRTSRLVKEITELIGGNESLAQVGSFYAECGRTISSNYIKEGLIIARDNNFPVEIIAFIKEHNFKLGYPKSRETAITMIICKLTSTIEFLESRGMKRNLSTVVDGVMDSCLMAGRLDASGLSLNEYKFIKDYLIEEARVSYDYFSGK